MHSYVPRNNIIIVTFYHNGCSQFENTEASDFEKIASASSSFLTFSRPSSLPLPTSFIKVLPLPQKINRFQLPLPHPCKKASKLDALEQHGRRQNLEIVGIPVTSNEDTNAIVQEITELLQVIISSKNISTSHCLQAKSKFNPPPIIVRFVNRDVRSRIYNNRKNARNADFTKLSIKGVEKIFINENLTYLKKKLFWKSKQKAKEAGFKFFWIMSGNVYVRKLEDDKPMLLKMNKTWALLNNFHLNYNL